MRIIDAETVLNRYQEICEGVACMDCPFYKDGCAVEKLILESAVVEAEPVRHGHWVDGKDMMYCSECSETYDKGYRPDYNYCPNCGAKMIPTIPKEIIDAVLGEDEVEE